MSRLLLAVALAFVTVVPAAGQVAGRWSLTLTGGIPPSVRGELRLSEDDDRLTGTLTLETRDSEPAQITGARLSSDGALEFHAELAGGMRFLGRWNGVELRGQAFAGDSLPRAWVASRLAEGAEYYPALPRFTLHQIIAGREDTTIRLPGRWAAAAQAAPRLASVDSNYLRLARTAGLAALSNHDLATARARRAMGALDRSALVAVVQRALFEIRAAIRSDAARQQFDQLFHPGGRWLTDLHDVALANARLRDGAVTWRSALPALVGVGLSRDAAEDDAILLALYRLTVLSLSDSAAFQAVIGDMRVADSVSAGRVLLLLAGYARATEWYAEAMKFFLTQPWAPVGQGRVASLEELVSDAWGRGPLPVPEIRPHLFGYPQAVPRVAVPSELFDRLVTAENRPAVEWLARHGKGELLRTLQRLPAPFEDNASLALAGRTIWFTSVGRQAERSAGGFLEPRDAILIDPGYVPVLALGTLVHEWQHILFERERLRPGGPGWPDPSADRVVTLRGADPYLAEGFAEWRAEEILRPLTERFPLLGLGEAEKRAGMARGQRDDPHLLGYLLVKVLAEVEPDPRRLQTLLIRYSGDPRGLSRLPAVSRALVGSPDVSDRALPAPGYQVLIPETRFTVEDGYPEVVSTRVIVPSEK